MTPAEYRAAAAPKKPPKYRNTRIEVAGEKFDSKKEYTRWRELCLRLKAGEITELRRQVPFKMEVNGEHICTYRADACWIEDGAQVVEDTKSPATRAEPSFRIKAKLLKACHGIELRVWP